MKHLSLALFRAGCAPVVLAAVAAFAVVCSASAQMPAPVPPASHAVLSPPDADLANPRARQSTAQAGRPHPVPLRDLPSFTVLGGDGQAVTSGSLAHAAHWLLLYRSASCLPCDRLMNVLAGSGKASLTHGAGIVVVVGGARPEDLDKVRLAFPGMEDTTWFADAGGGAFKALKAEGSPMLVGLSGARIEWAVSGNLGNPARVESLASSWLQPPAAHAASGAAPAAKGQTP